MISHDHRCRLAMLAFTISLGHAGLAQARPAATQQLHIAAFVGGAGTQTGLATNSSADVTAGIDVTFRSSQIINPSFELRGTYPVRKNPVADERNFLAGPRFEYPVGRMRPYADILVGRGRSEYLNGGYVRGNVLYFSSITTVYSPGLGLDYDLSHRIALKADFQYQCWSSPVVVPGTIHPKSFILGGVYRFDFNRDHGRWDEPR
jgi:hypothetical protein